MMYKDDRNRICISSEAVEWILDWEFYTDDYFVRFFFPAFLYLEIRFRMIQYRNISGVSFYSITHYISVSPQLMVQSMYLKNDVQILIEKSKMSEILLHISYDASMHFKKGTLT